MLFQVKITFWKFETESTYDYVNIYDGNSTSAPLRLSHSGDVIPDPLATYGNDVYITFTSDGSVTHSGFFIQFTRVTNRNYHLSYFFSIFWCSALC